MNWAPPTFLQDALKKAAEIVETNHYSIPRGRIRLRKALSEYMSPSFKLPGGRALDPNSEIVITAGANEGELKRYLDSRQRADYQTWDRYLRICNCFLITGR